MVLKSRIRGEDDEHSLLSNSCSFGRQGFDGPNRSCAERRMASRWMTAPSCGQDVEAALRLCIR